MFEAKAKLVFDPENRTKKHEKQSSWKKTAVAFLSDDTEDYYRYLLYKRFDIHLKKTIRGSHLTVINDKIADINKWNELKSIYDGQELTLQYDPRIFRSNGNHWWIKAYSNDAMYIRSQLGLGNPYYGLHITVGSVVDLPYRIEHNEYILRLLKDYEL